MGLDMYLYKENYVKNYSYMNEKEKHYVTVLHNNTERKDIKSDRVAYVVEQVGYWRKFNALHNYFVNVIGDGVDNCERITVEIEHLKNLLETLNKVKNSLDENGYPNTINPTIALELLPPTSGFFFGGTEIDEFYYESVSNTIDLLNNIINEFDSIEPLNKPYFYYLASW